jgi:tetratricopeptide (TPR) repeat protein
MEKWAPALADLDKAVALDPAPSAPYLHRAEVYRRMNRTPEAVADYTRGLERDPKSVPGHYARGNLRLAAQDFAGAQEDFAALAELQPDDPVTHKLYGVSSLRRGDFAAAHKAWAGLARLMPMSAEPLRNDGITFKVERRYNDAIKAYGDAIRIEPNDSQAYLSRAQLYHQIGKFKEAEADIFFVLDKLKQREGTIFSDHGDLLRTMKRLPEAVAAYENSIRVLPKQSDAYTGASLAHVLDKQPEKAMEVLDRLAKTFPGARAHIRRAETRRNLGQWDEALHECEEAAKLDPKSPLPVLTRLSVVAARGEYKQAVTEAEALLAASPPDGNARYAAACVWSLASDAAAAAGQADLAKQYVDRAAGLIADIFSKSFLEMNFQAFNRLLEDPALAAARRHPTVRELLPVLQLKNG